MHVCLLELVSSQALVPAHVLWVRAFSWLFGRQCLREVEEGSPASEALNFTGLPHYSVWEVTIRFVNNNENVEKDYELKNLNLSWN